MGMSRPSSRRSSRATAHPPVSGRRVNREIKEMIRDDVAAWHRVSGDLSEKMDGLIIDIGTRMEKLSNRVFYMMGFASILGALMALMIRAGYKAAQGG